MFVPLNDDTPLKLIRFQYVSLFIIALNVVLFLFTGVVEGDAALASTALSFGVVPSELLYITPHVSIGGPHVPEPLTLVTYMFLHAGWMHLIGNMAFLWVFADNVEDTFGHVGFIMFYLLCGVAGGMLHTLMMPDSHQPLVGASGAVSGVLAAYLLLYPRARVWILLLMKIPLRIPAIVVLGGWIILQVVNAFIPQAEGEAVAWWAHIGGFATGLILTLLLRSPLILRQPSTS